jgi:signal peptidase II
MSVQHESPEAPEVAPSRRYRRRFFALAALVLLGLDQLTKWLVVTHLDLGQSHPLGALLSLTYNRNTGAAFGMWHGGGRALAAAAVVLIIMVLIWGGRFASGNRLIGWGMACLIGGALGNLVDRLRLGYVVDFIDLHFWPVFNLADTAVVIGAGLLLLYALLAAPGDHGCAPAPACGGCHPEERHARDEGPSCLSSAPGPEEEA